MTKHLLAGLAAFVLMSGVASAQTYPPAPPLMPNAPPPPPIPATPPSLVPYSSTTTVTPTPEVGYRASTVNKSVDANGNQVTKQHIYNEGVAGSSETTRETETTPFGGTTTRSTTTTTPR